MSDKPKPAHQIRLETIKATIWKNDTQNGVRHNVTVVRIYKDGDTWKDSTSFGRDDLPVVREVIDQAWKWIYSEGANTRSAAA